MAIRTETVTHPLSENIQISWTNDTTALGLSFLNHKMGIKTPSRAQSCNKIKERVITDMENTELRSQKREINTSG